MAGRPTSLVVVLAVVTAGCVNPGNLLTGGAGDRITMEDLPGLGELDLADASLQVEGSDCVEAHLFLPANASVARARTPVDLELGERDGNESRIAASVTRCDRWHLENATADQDASNRTDPSDRINRTIRQATIVELSIPVEPPGQTQGRHDWLLTVLASDLTLVEALAQAGLPARSPAELSVELDRLHEIATRIVVDLDDRTYPADLAVTSVSIETELPFGTASSVGRTRWAPTSEGRVKVETELNVTELGGLSGGLDTRPGSELARLMGNTTQSAYGFQARYDVRWGVIPVAPGEGPTAWTDTGPG